MGPVAGVKNLPHEQMSRIGTSGMAAIVDLALI
jgi:hypothetical protein